MQDEPCLEAGEPEVEPIGRPDLDLRHRNADDSQHPVVSFKKVAPGSAVHCDADCKKSRKGLGAIEVGLGIFGLLLNLGIFSIPRAFASAGLLMGSLAVVFVPLLCMVTSRQLGHVFAELRSGKAKSLHDACAQGLLKPPQKKTKLLQRKQWYPVPIPSDQLWSSAPAMLWAARQWQISCTHGACWSCSCTPSSTRLP